MSNYTNMTVDFPARIADLLSVFEKPAAARGREVTLLLALAGPAITLPLERLHQKHPSGDYLNNPELADLDQRLQVEPFLGSSLWPEASPGSWRYGGPLLSTEGDPDSWEELSRPTPPDSHLTSWQVLRHVRNALSHGNAYTRGLTHIDNIAFLAWVSRSDHRYMYLLVSPSDFRLFLGNWLSLLKLVRFPSIVVAEEFAAA